MYYLPFTSKVKVKCHPYLKHEISKVFKNLLVFKNEFLKTLVILLLTQGIDLLGLSNYWHYMSIISGQKRPFFAIL